MKDGDMKTETITYVREATSSAGWGWVSGTAAPDSTASQIKNCTIVRQPKILERGNGVHFHKDEGSAPKRPQLSPRMSPSDSTPKFAA
jgi:hypothetical protein